MNKLLSVVHYRQWASGRGAGAAVCTCDCTGRFAGTACCSRQPQQVRSYSHQRRSRCLFRMTTCHDTVVGHAAIQCELLLADRCAAAWSFSRRLRKPMACQTAAWTSSQQRRRCTGGPAVSAPPSCVAWCVAYLQCWQPRNLVRSFTFMCTSGSTCRGSTRKRTACCDLAECSQRGATTCASSMMRMQTREQSGIKVTHMPPSPPPDV